MKLLRILAAGICSAVAVSAAAQEFKITPIGNSFSRANISIAVDPDDLGRVSGRVLSGDGKPIAKASVVVYDGVQFNGGKSGKDGSYSVGGRFGVHAIEVCAPGYRKFTGEADMPKGGEAALDVVMEPAEGVEDAENTGYRVTCRGNALTLTVDAKHPMYEGKSLLDVLRDTPMLAVGDGKFSVAGNESVDFYTNGRPVRAPFDAALKFFGSIDAAKVKSVRVMMWGMSISAWVSISYAE